MLVSVSMMRKGGKEVEEAADEVSDDEVADEDSGEVKVFSSSQVHRSGSI